MKPLRFVCLLAIFISAVALAQSKRIQPIDKPKWAPIAQEHHPLESPSFRRQRAKFAQGDANPSGLKFATAVTYGSGGWLTGSVAVADVNGDGKLDLIVANYCVDSTCGSNGTVGVLIGNGDGTFQTALTYESGGRLAVSVTVADVNSDGKPDLLVADNCDSTFNCDNGTVGVLIGNGDGTFEAAVAYGSGGYQAYSVVVGDINGDGKPDLLVANPCITQLECGISPGSIGVLIGNGDGTFQTAVTYDSGGALSYRLAIGDVNADGKLDVVVTAECGISCTNGGGVVGVLIGNGDGTFQTEVSYSLAYAAFFVVVAEVNGDGKPDLIVSNGDDGIVSVLLGKGDGTFGAAVPYSSGGSDSSVAVADVNGDGKLDVLVTNDCSNCKNGSVGVLLGNGDGTFQTVITYGSGGWDPASVAVADVNGDGKPDLLVTNYCLNSASSSSCAANTDGLIAVLINTSSTPTTTALTSSLNPSNFGQSVILTATVTALPGFDKGTPTQTVSFFDGTSSLGSSSLNSSGVATLSTSTLSVGTHSITATYNGDSNFASSTSLVLNQVVQGAIVSFSPTSLSFGNQTVGIASPSQKVTLSNTGNIALTVTAVAISGANGGDFVQTNNCGTSVSAGGNCTMTVTFTPATSGARNASLSITDNAPGSPQTVPLSGVGVVPTVTLSPNSLTFSNQVVFTTSAAQTVTLTNTGLGNLSITKISVTGAFTQTNTCGTVNAGASCTISVKFKPTTSGTLTGSISITDNASGSPQKITLTGTGTDVQFTPTSLNFGNQPKGTKSLPKKITLSNKASVSVSITSISITGTNKGDFSETNTCGKTVKAGASCSITVTFTPAAKGKRTGNVSVSDNGGGSPQTVGLSGTGT